MINPCRCAEPYQLKPVVLLGVHGLQGLRGFFVHKNFLGFFWFRYADILNTSIQTRATLTTRAEPLVSTVSEIANPCTTRAASISVKGNELVVLSARLSV